MSWETIGYWAEIISSVALIIMLWATTIGAVADGRAGVAAIISPLAVIMTGLAILSLAIDKGWLS